MGESLYEPRGLYFEEFKEGESLATAGRTITEADVVTFAGMSGDFNQIHTNAEYAAADTFGQRVAHGLLVVAITTGLVVRTGIMEGTVLAFRELEWKFSRPVFIGDTIHAVLEVRETKPLPRLGGGSVKAKISVLNQENQVVQRGQMVLLVKSKLE
ncbi:MAG: MaoC/PaaZ C-terminal domain-containing protein [Candidatus Promineifilaceae bacterium]